MPSRKPVKVRAIRRKRKFAPAGSFGNIAASALAFIKAAGGMANAKATIDMIQQVREAV